MGKAGEPVEGEAESGEEEEEGDEEEEEKKPKAKKPKIEKAAPAPAQEQKKKHEEAGSEADFELFVNNFPQQATEDKVKEFFSKYGEVTSIKLLQRVSTYLIKNFIGWTTNWKRICSL